MAATQLSGLQIPANWMDYIQLLTTVGSPLVDSGVLVRASQLDEKMQGGNVLINMPHFQDLPDDSANVSTDAPGSSATPNDIPSGLEIGVRLSRNQVWSSMDLNDALIAEDVMAAIESRTSAFWRRHAQSILVDTAKGVFANNEKASPGGGATQEDMVVDVSDDNGGNFLDGVTNFTAEAFIDATHTMGDAQEDLGIVMVTPTVHATMLKKDLIDFQPDSEGKMTIPTFHGRRVVVSRKVPSSGNVHDTWIFGPGAFLWGMSQPKVPAATQREELTGDGGGQDILVQRVEWVVHPRGLKWSASTTANGGPANGTSANQLGHEDSWVRAYNEREQIPMAKLKTREA